MWNPISLFKRPRTEPIAPGRSASRHRSLRAEQLEVRRLMAADPIHVGMVYIETDYLEGESGFGSDTVADRFILSFTGGADDTTMTEFRLSLDKDSDGMSIGDLIFDTAPGGLGKAGWHPFKVVQVSSMTGERITVDAEVDDGSTELVVKLSNFKAGDVLEFSIDVDEVLRMHADLDRFNQALDVMVSGQEMQDAIFDATFEAPHYETTTGRSLFVNDFGNPNDLYGLKIPPDEGIDVDSRPSRTAAAIGTVQQTPKPISIAGSVWVDNNLNLVRDAGEQPLAGVTVALLRKNESSGRFEDTGHRQITAADGSYRFDTALGLMPGEYQIVQTQPDEYFSVGAVVGLVNGSPIGQAASSDILTGINIPLGDLHAVNYDFAEAQAADVSGYVYVDANDNGRRDGGETGIGGVTIRLVPRDTLAPQSTIETVTAADGSYSFTNLPPGLYDIIEVTQPAGWDDGRDSPGTVNGIVVGIADEPGDAIRDVMLLGNSSGLQYNFGELPRGSLSGGVYLAPPGADCAGPNTPGATPLAGVEIQLLDAVGTIIAITYTGADGQYLFEDISKGVYSIIEITPEGLLDGHASAGTVDGQTVGTGIGGGLIQDIFLPAGASGIRYDFCEAAPAQISGYVYHDQNDNGRRESGEQAIAGTVIELVDEDGQIVATTRTDSDGFYQFQELLPGNYTIRQQQPTGYLDGLDTAGTIDGITVGQAINPGDKIRDIELRQGQIGLEYNFGELMPASLSGRVHVDTNDNCYYDEGELLLSGVVIRLFDDDGNEVARTTTNSEGRYSFTGLPPGTYTVVEEQPDGYFSGTARPGSAGGIKESPDRIGNITLGSGQVAVDYDFCEKPPAEISGYVYVDHNHNQQRDAGETAIGAVKIDLYDAAGQWVASTTTDASGYYRFSHLPKGEYTLRQTQPDGYLQGSQQAGSAGGNDDLPDVISEVPIAFGAILTQYNFGELLPSSLSGYVFVDMNGDCYRQDGEAGIEGVLIELYSDSGLLVLQTYTNSDGFYEFTGLEPGQYRVVETQPDGYFSGAARPGSGGGRADGSDIITEIPIGPGQTLVDYNFCEKLPATISGTSYLDYNTNDRLDSGDRPSPGVTIELIDDDGRVVQSTVTDANGFYQFTGLRPGTYSLRQVQPSGVFHHNQLPGSLGGNDSIDDIISAIVLPGGAVATDYDFTDVPPAEISGYVFQDGAPLVMDSAPNPEDLRDYRDGIRNADSIGLAGVILQLRNAQGQPVSADRALPGIYDGIIQVVTDANGFYQFTGLRAGDYHVYQLQPDGYIDSLDTAGSGGGVALNAADTISDPVTTATLDVLRLSAQTDPGHDAILHISLRPGSLAQENNFSEILIQPPDEPAPPIEPPAARPEELQTPPPGLPPLMPQLASFGQPLTLQNPLVADAEYEVTWHLSIVNGGTPAGNGKPALFRQISQREIANDDSLNDKRRGKWMLVDREGNLVEAGQALTLGGKDAIPLVGDFNGDGVDEIAVYVGGQWFVDLNGNGVWDEGDLWIRLGNELDRPVVGDWDGDGKADVAIFGRQWQYDPEAIVEDPGLPTPANSRRRDFALPASTRMRAVQWEQHRELRQGQQGDVRSDAVDHVFRYGEQADTPLAGDWNGDGIDSVAIFRAGQWTLNSSGDGRMTKDDQRVSFGQPGDIAIVGDWNGDGITDLGVVRGDVWIIDSDGDRRLTANDLQLEIPKPHPDATPVVGDWDGDGKDEFGWYYHQAE